MMYWTDGNPRDDGSAGLPAGCPRAVPGCDGSVPEAVAKFLAPGAPVGETAREPQGASDDSRGQPPDVVARRRWRSASWRRRDDGADGDEARGGSRAGDVADQPADGQHREVVEREIFGFRISRTTRMFPPGYARDLPSNTRLRIVATTIVVLGTAYLTGGLPWLLQRLLGA